MRISARVVALAGVLLLHAPIVSAQRVNDAQIASVVVTANQVDIDTGKLATSKATNGDVKAFARLMVTDHTAVNKSATDLAAKLKVTPEDNPTSRSLKADGDKSIAHLKTLKGAAFDEAYVDCEVAYHQQVTRDLGFIVTDGDAYFSEEKRDARSETVQVAPGIPAYRIQNTAADGRYRIEKEILTDPWRDVVLQRVRFVPLQGCTAQDTTTRDTTLGVHIADLETRHLSNGDRVHLTFYWPEAERWEQVDFLVCME
jgi:putative membrane protein